MRQLLRLVQGRPEQLASHVSHHAWWHWRCFSTSTLPSQAQFPEKLGAGAHVGLAERAWTLALQEGQAHSGLEDAWEALEAQVVEHSGTLSGNDIVRILHACTIARRRPRKLLGRLRKEMLQKLPQTNSEGLCICLHAYAQMRERSEGRLFTLVTRHILTKDTLPPAQLASLLYSHVRMLFADQKLWAAAEERLISACSSFNPEDLATTIQAFATLKVREMAASAACQRTAVEHCKQEAASLEALCDILHAFSRLAAPRQELQRALLHRIRSSEQELRSLSAQSIVRLFHGFAGYARADAAFQQELGAALAQQLPQLNGPYDLVQALDAFQKAKYRESPIEELCGRIIIDMVDFSPKDVIAVATACDQLSLKDAALLEAVGRQALRKVQWLKPRQLHVVIQSLQAGGLRHAILGELRDRAEELAEQRAAKKAPPASSEGDSAEQPKEVGLELEEQAYFAEPRLGKESVDVTSAWKSLGKPRSRRSGGKPSERRAALADKQDQWLREQH